MRRQQQALPFSCGQLQLQSAGPGSKPASGVAASPVKTSSRQTHVRTRLAGSQRARPSIMHSALRQVWHTAFTSETRKTTEVVEFLAGAFARPRHRASRPARVPNGALEDRDARRRSAGGLNSRVPNPEWDESTVTYLWFRPMKASRASSTIQTRRRTYRPCSPGDRRRTDLPPKSSARPTAGRWWRFSRRALVVP